MIRKAGSRFVQLETRPITQYGLLVAITLLAAVLRFYKLGEWSFWIDEINTLNRAQIIYGNFDSLINNIPPAFTWMPLSVIFTAGVLNVFGVYEWSARLIPAIIGSLSIPVLYFPIRKILGTGIGLITVLLLAVSPWHIYWSQNARFYTSLMLLYTLALFALYFGMERDRLKYILLFIILTYLASSERLIALFIVPVVALYLLLLKVLPIEKPSGFRRRNMLVLLVPGVIAGILEVYSIVIKGSSVIFDVASRFIGRSVDDPFRLLSFISFNVGIPLMVLAFFGGLFLIMKWDRAGLFLFLSAVVPVSLLLLLNRLVFTQDRYAFVTLPAWLILGAVSVRESFHRAQGQGKLLAVAIICLLLADAGGANLLYFQVSHGNRLDWKGAFAIVEHAMREGDVIVTTRPKLANYYLSEDVVNFELEREVDSVVNGSERVWFVLDSIMVWNSARSKKWVEDQAVLIEVLYLRVPQDLSVRIYQYDP